MVVRRILRTCFKKANQDIGTHTCIFLNRNGEGSSTGTWCANDIFVYLNNPKLSRTYSHSVPVLTHTLSECTYKSAFDLLLCFKSMHHDSISEAGKFKSSLGA